METLRLVDVTDDGHLVVMAADGRRFRLAVDEHVRAAVRRDRTAAAAPRGDRPGPREVQARIRAGADAETVAEATGLELAYVQRFEGPALDERRHVAELARRSTVYRDHGSRPVTLEAAVSGVLAEDGHDAESLLWDSRRIEGSRWDVTAATDPPGILATWRFDVTTRSIEEIDDPARRLTRIDARRLSPVRDGVFDIEAGRSAARARRTAAAVPQTSSTAALLESLAQQRGRRPSPASPDPDATIVEAGVTALSPARGLRPTRAVDLDADTDDAELGTGEIFIDPALLDDQVDSDTPRPAPRPATTRRPPAVRTPVGPARGRPTAHQVPRTVEPETSPPAPVVAAAPPVAGDAVAREDVAPQPPRARRAAAKQAATKQAAPKQAAPKRPTANQSVPKQVVGDKPSRRRRTGVPSWDDIVFGARTDGDD